MTPQKDNYDELIVMLTSRDHEICHNIRIGKAVTQHFVPNPNNYKFIKHNDGNKLKCRAIIMYNNFDAKAPDMVSGAFIIFVWFI